MINYLKTIWRPEVYHGFGKRGNFFEGWFYKIVDQKRKNVFSFIPGVSLGSDPHAFIQVLDGQTHQSDYLRFLIDDFFASSKKLEIKIDKNIFTSNSINLELALPNKKINGILNFNQLKPWPVTLFTPGIMGWYSFIPFMECFHGVVSLDHEIRGSLAFNGRTIDFKNGRGYIEKDWGKSFPSSYIWIQSNHFDQIGISLIVSVANIPWLKGSFRGFIIGFLYKGQLHQFTTYNGGKINSLALTEDQVRLEVVNRKHKLIIQAMRSVGGLLHAPYETRMVQHVSESLSSQVHIQFFVRDKRDDQTVFSGFGKPAALETYGHLEQIIDNFIS